MNTDLMFSSKTDLWATPQAFFDDLNKEFGFTLDVCAIPENAKCSRFFSPTVNGLAQTWEGVCWCNPPYGREVGKWVKKAAEFAYECAIPLLAGMFADSEICRNVFNEPPRNDNHELIGGTDNG